MRSTAPSRHDRRTRAEQRHSWRSGPPVEADQRDLEVAGITEEIHDFHHVAIADRLVGAQVNALVLLALSCGVQRRGKRVADNDVLADRDRQIRLDGHEDRLFRPRLRLYRARRKVDAEIDGGERRRHHEDDQQHQHHVDEWRDVDLMGFGEIVIGATRAYSQSCAHARYSAARAARGAWRSRLSQRLISSSTWAEASPSSAR